MEEAPSTLSPFRQFFFLILSILVLVLYFQAWIPSLVEYRESIERHFGIKYED